MPGFQPVSVEFVALKPLNYSVKEAPVYAAAIERSSKRLIVFAGDDSQI